MKTGGNRRQRVFAIAASTDRFAQQAGDFVDVFVAAAGHVEDDDVVARHLGDDLGRVGERVRALECGDDALEMAAELEGLERLVVGGVAVLDAARVAEVGVLGPDARVGEPGGVVDGALADSSKRLIAEDRTWSYHLHDGQRRIIVTQNDVRQIQLAKAALYAGAKLLLDRAGLKSVDRIRLAGAFGSHIDPKYAMVLGMIPDCELDKVKSAGNAAGTGARIALLNVGARREIESVVRSIEKIETAVEKKFQEYFVNAMAIPNKIDAFPHLFSVMEKPQAKIVINVNSGRGSSRRRRKATSP